MPESTDMGNGEEEVRSILEHFHRHQGKPPSDLR